MFLAIVNFGKNSPLRFARILSLIKNNQFRSSQLGEAVKH